MRTSSCVFPTSVLWLNLRRAGGKTWKVWERIRTYSPEVCGWLFLEEKSNQPVTGAPEVLNYYLHKVSNCPDSRLMFPGGAPLEKSY